MNMLICEAVSLHVDKTVWLYLIYLLDRFSLTGLVKCNSNMLIFETC